MDRKVMERLEDNLCEIAKDYAERGMKSASDVETVKHVLSGMLKIKCLEEMDNYQSGGSFRGRSYDGDMSHDGSYRRDSRGRYMDSGSYRYSHDSGMREKLQHMMEGASEHERQVIQEMMGRL